MRLCVECSRSHGGTGYPLYNPACLWCGARIIQQIGRFQIPASESVQRRRDMLALWLKHGHSESEIRRLAKGTALPLQPER